MPRPYLKLLGIFFTFFIFAQASTSSDQEDGLAFAKRSLLEKEKEYLKGQPMSSDLKQFIERHKRKSLQKTSERRNKRSQGLDESSLYVIQNGQLVPFKNMKGFKRQDEERKAEPQGYTVVPLVVPIIPEAKLVKTRTLDEQLQQMEQAKDDKAVSSPQTQISTTPALTPADNKAVMSKPEDGDEAPEAAEGSSNNTTEETQVLHKILDDVQGLLQSRKEGNKKEGVICNLNGSWVSDAAGMRFDVTYQNSTRKKFRIHVADRIPPNEDGFLCDGNWTVFGEIPFKHSGMVIALAVHERDKHIATFIGECRVCEGSETVTGTWLLARSSRDCKDQKAAHKVLSDVWRREQGHTLRKKHLQEIGMKGAEED